MFAFDFHVGPMGFFFVDKLMSESFCGVNIVQNEVSVETKRIEHVETVSFFLCI